MNDDKKKAFFIKKKILQKFLSLIFNENGSLDLLQILLFSFYILLGIQIMKTTFYFLI